MTIRWQVMSLPEPFGKYELLEQIGTGGMAEVFLARTFGVAGFEKRLVIKRIRPEHASDPRFVSLFINEAKIGVHLNHPNIVAVYELGKVGGSHYIAMEHLHGRDLNKVARVWRGAEPGLPHELAVGIVAEVARGLAYAHGDPATSRSQVALVHRDVSPHNIFLTFAGEVKLVDFGIARLLDGQAPVPESDCTPKRPAGGKYAYMSPEQASGEAVDHRTDIYSAGVVLWELLAGRKLYQGSDPEEKLARVKAARIEPPRPDLDDDLWAILQRALARDPDDRCADAALFEEDLRAWLHARRLRADNSLISHLMRESFPDGSQKNPAAMDLRRLADDIGRLDPTEGSTSSHPSTHPPNSHTEHTPRDSLQPPSEERKRVGVLVVDVDGFTDISLHAEPEVLFKRHLQMFRWLRSIVAEHGGRIQRAHDDQIYLFFGVPRTRRDDLRRALAAAADLQRRISELHESGIPVELAIGMHTGEVTLTSDDARRYMARGNTTRLARRLSEQADHRQVLVSEEVQRAVGSAFEWERGPWLLGRGGKPPVPSFRMVRRASLSTLASHTPWLKRGRELEVLRDALIDVGEGRGNAVVLQGEEGCGKTRLIKEFCAVAQRRRVPVHSGSAGPFGHRLKLLHEVLRDLLQLGETTPSDPTSPPGATPRAHDLHAQVEGLRPLGLFPRDLELFTQLLSARAAIDSSDVWNAFGRLLRGLSDNGPLVVVLEELHHLDPEERVNLERLISRLSSSSVLVLMSWSGREPEPLRGARSILLEPLSPALQLRMVSALLHGATVGDGLAQLVERTCEGNPLYIEELVKYLHAEQHVAVREGRAELVGESEPALPDTVAGLIAARIDDLDPASKGALQLAAVIGQRFSLPLLGEVIGVDDPFDLAADLAAHGLVTRLEGEQWEFASNFVQQAALRGILGVQRRDYHRLIADALERRGNSEGIHAELLAKHCGRGGRPLDAARYTYQAGQHLERDQAFIRARNAYRAGLAWLADANEAPATWDARVQGETMLRLRLGAMHLILGDTTSGLRELQLALDTASDAGLPWLEIRGHLQLAAHHVHGGAIQLAGAHLQQAQAMVRMESDEALEIEVLEASANLAIMEGRLVEARDAWRRAVTLSRGRGALHARCLLGLANYHLRIHELHKARPILEEALDVAHEEGDRLLEGRVLNNIGLLLAWQDQHEAAIRHFRQALQVREDIGYSRGQVVNHHNIGDVHFSRGDPHRAYVAFQRSRELADEMGWQRGVAMNEVYLGFLDADRGDEHGIGRLQDATSLARALGDSEVAVTGAWLLGRHLFGLGRPADARPCLQEALEEARALEMLPMVEAIQTELQSASPQG